MAIEIPKISHLQYAALTVLASTEKMLGNSLRTKLIESFGLRYKAEPKFYQFMARLEKSGLVTAEYQSKMEGSQLIREREYCLTDAGKKAVVSVIRFYESFGLEFTHHPLR